MDSILCIETCREMDNAMYKVVRSEGYDAEYFSTSRDKHCGVGCSDECKRLNRCERKGIQGRVKITVTILGYIARTSRCQVCQEWQCSMKLRRQAYQRSLFGDPL